MHGPALGACITTILLLGHLGHLGHVGLSGRCGLHAAQQALDPTDELGAGHAQLALSLGCQLPQQSLNSKSSSCRSLAEDLAELFDRLADRSASERCTPASSCSVSAELGQHGLHPGAQPNELGRVQTHLAAAGPRQS